MQKHTHKTKMAGMLILALSVALLTCACGISISTPFWSSAEDSSLDDEFQYHGVEFDISKDWLKKTNDNIVYFYSKTGNSCIMFKNICEGVEPMTQEIQDGFVEGLLESFDDAKVESRGVAENDYDTSYFKCTITGESEGAKIRMTTAVFDGDGELVSATLMERPDAPNEEFAELYQQMLDQAESGYDTEDDDKNTIINDSPAKEIVDMLTP